MARWAQGDRAAFLLVMVAGLSRLPTLTQPIVETHPFRQVQTAFPALEFARNGIDLLHPSVPVLGPPYTVPFEFPLLQAMAALLIDLGLGSDVAVRFVALVSFLATAVAGYLFLRRVVSDRAGLLFLVFFLFSPFAFLWARAGMIEYLATFGAVGALAAGTAWVDDDDRRWWAVAIVLGAVAATVKLSTWAFWTVPLFWALRRRGVDWSPGFIVAGLALIVVPGALGLAWTLHADAVKAASPWTSWLTSAALSDWNFGEPWQRTSIRVWWEIGERVAFLLMGWLLAALVPWVLLGWRAMPWTLLGALVVAVVGPPIAFINLYWVHDYYLAAVTPAVAMLLAILAGAFVGRSPWRAGLAVAVVAAFVVANGWYWAIAYQGTKDPEQVLPSAAEVAAVSSPDDVVIVEGRDWASGVHYYAGGRRGYAIPYDIHPAVVATLASVRSAVVQTGDLGLINLWPWAGSVGPSLYVVATSEDALTRSEPLFRVSTQPPAGTGGIPPGAWQRLEVACGRAPLDLPDVPSGRLVLRPEEARGAVSVPGLDWLPVREWVQLDGPTAGKGLVCAATDRIVFEWAVAE